MARHAMRAITALLFLPLAWTLSGCSTDLKMSRVVGSSAPEEIAGIPFYLSIPYVKKTTYEVRDLVEDKDGKRIKMDPYLREVIETEMLPDTSQVFYANYRAGVFTKNEFKVEFAERLSSSPKSISVNSSSQVPDVLKPAGEFLTSLAGVSEKVFKAAGTPEGSKKVGEEVTVKTVEYYRMKEGAVIK